MSDAATVSYTLSAPLKSLDQTFTVLIFRRPTGKDLKRSGDPENGVVFTQNLAEILCGLVPNALDDADAADVLAIGKIVSGFLAPRPPVS